MDSVSRQPPGGPVRDYTLGGPITLKIINTNSKPNRLEVEHLIWTGQENCNPNYEVYPRSAQLNDHMAVRSVVDKLESQSAVPTKRKSTS